MAVSWHYDVSPRPFSVFTENLMIESQLSDHGYHALDHSHKGGLDYFGVDQVFMQQSQSKAVFVKYGVKPSEQRQLNRLVGMQGGWLYHSRMSTGLYVALFFHGYKKTQAQAVLAQVDSVFSLDNSRKEAYRPWYRLLIPTAHASSGQHCQEKSQTKTIDQALEQGRGQSLMQVMEDCGAKAIDGARSQFSSLFPDWDSVNSPAKIWKSVQVRWNQFKEVTTRLDELTRQVLSVVRQMDADQQVQVACQLAGQLTPSILASLSGVGAVGGVLSLTQLTGRLARLTEILGELGGSVAGSRATDVQIARLIENMILGKISPDFEKISSRLTSQGHNQAALGVLSCVAR